MQSEAGKIIAATLVATLCISIGSASATARSGDLESRLHAMEASGSKVSAKIVNLNSGRTLLDVNGDRSLNPASTIKLFVAYAALARLGIDYRFQTKVFRAEKGGLCVQGGGDPSFVMEDLYLMAQGLKENGVRSYSGKITLDSSVFDGQFYPEGRIDQESERAYNAPIWGLSFNYNTVSVFVEPTQRGRRARVHLDWPYRFVRIRGKVMTGSVTDVVWGEKTSGQFEMIDLGGEVARSGEEWRKPFRISNPARAFGEAFSEMLAQVGIRAMSGNAYRPGKCLGDPVYVYSSQPLSAIVGLMDKYSNNFIADSLVKTLDHEVNHRPGTEAGGLSLIRETLRSAGVDMDQEGRRYVSGSGLTDENAVAADDFIRLLHHIYREKVMLPEIFSSLPIAGVDGTLKKRYLHSEVENRLRAKTGSLDRVHSLVGVYPDRAGDWLGVAIVINGAQEVPETELARFLSAR